MRHIQNTGRLLNTAFLYMVSIPVGIYIWWKDLLFQKQTLGFNIATGLFSFLVGLFLTIELSLRDDFGVSSNINIAFFWGVVTCLAGFIQLYSASHGGIRLRQVAAITQFIIYLFFLILTLLSASIGLIIPIILTQLILLFVSSVRLTQEAMDSGY